MSLMSACSPSAPPAETSNVISIIRDSDSIAIAEYNYDRQARYDDSVSAQHYADSLRAAKPAKPIPIEEEHIAAMKKMFYFFDDEMEIYPCQVENPDTMIHGIVLNDIATTIAVLGREWNLIEDNADMPHQNYSNAHGSQFLTCFFHYGGGKNEFSEFQVSRNCAEVKTKALPDEAFITGKGIQLGMSKDSVISRIGSCYVTDSFDGNLVLKYVAEDYDNSKFLQRWRYPKYYAWYEFKEDKLIRFRFGFEYP